MKKTETEIIVKTSVKIMIFNVFLAIIKIIGGIIGKSSALISDAVNSISDIVTNLVVMITGKMSHKERDARHPYGHEKFDSLVSIFLGAAILVTAFEIIRSAGTTLYQYFFNSVDIPTPHYAALAIALATILIKEYMYHFTIHSAKKANSPSLRAQAMDHRGDELASFGAFIGIGGAILGFAYLEPIASIFIGFFVGRLGFHIIKDGVSQVVDEAADEEVVTSIQKVISEFPEVYKIDELWTRQFGLKVYVDLEISLDRGLTLCEAHAISEKVHDAIEEKVPDVIHAHIHVNPSNPDCDKNK